MQGLQCSTGGWLIEPETMRTMKASGLVMPRVEAGPEPDVMARWCLDAGLEPLIICFTLDQMRLVPAGLNIHVSLGNEPDLHHANNPWPGTSYRDAIPEAVEIAAERQLNLWIGEVSNPNNRGLAFLASLNWASIPTSIGCSTHWYPTPPSIDAGHDGRSQDQEVAAVKAIVGADRALACTETGFHEGDFTKAQVLEGLAKRREFLKRHGYQIGIAYQIIDAPPGTNPGERYGFQTHDRQWKPERVEAWTGQPFLLEPPPIEPPPVDPPPAPRVYHFPIDVSDGLARMVGTLSVTVALLEPPPIEPPEPPEDRPVADLTMLVQTESGAAIVGAIVTNIDAPENVHPAAGPRTSDGNGFVHVPVYSDIKTLFSFEAAGYLRHEQAFPPGDKIQVPLTKAPMTPSNREPKGAARLNRHALEDDKGTFLGLGFSLFWVLRAFRDYRDRYDANLAWAAAHWFNSYRGFASVGGWPPPDGWRDAGMGPPDCYTVLPQVLDDAFARYRMRCSLTLFDGMVLFPTFEQQDAHVRKVCGEILKPRMHTLQDLQIANEYGPCQWDQHPKGIEWLRAHAKTARSILGPQALISVSTMNATMNDAPQDQAVAEARSLFDLSVVNIGVPHYSREVHMIDGPWRHVRQPWERVLHDSSGKPVTPDSAIDDEGMGPRSSVAEENDASRLVGRAMVAYVSGVTAHTLHTDAGIWSNLLNPPHKGMGEFTLVQDHPAAAQAGEAFNRLLPLLPNDLPNWTRTRHGLPGHPFGDSFKRIGDTYTQIWPDGHTAHGCVRFFIAVNGQRFIGPITGIRDHIDLKWTAPMLAKFYSCATGQLVGEITEGTTLRVPESWDTDVLVIGRFL